MKAVPEAEWMPFLAVGVRLCKPGFAEWGIALQDWLCRVALGFGTLSSNMGTQESRLSENARGQSSLQNGARQLDLEKIPS